MPNLAEDDLSIDEREALETLAREQEQARQAIFERFAEIVREKRDDAIKARAESGIEIEWREDEEHYEGIDDANRHTSGLKPKALTGSFQQRDREPPTRSTLFLNITRPYCDAAAARVADMLLPTDDRNWALKPTPVPDLVRQLQDKRPLRDANGQPLMRPVTDASGEPQMAPGQMVGADGQAMMQPVMQPMTVADMAQRAIDEARQAADRAQDQIDDQLVECRYHAEVRKVIESTAKLGTGILKGPYPLKRRSKAAMQTPQGWALVIQDAIRPASRVIDPWNFYPDPSCGDDIQNGSYTIERDDISARQLMDLKGLDGYLEDQIDAVLLEGPIDSRTKTRRLKQGQELSQKDQYEIWYFHGMVSRKDLEAAGCDCGDDGDENEQYPAIVTLVNDRVIKAALSPLDSGEFPYDVMVWQRRVGHWAGIGVARQMRTCQRGLNAAARNLMDNAGLAAGPQIVVDRSKIVPADGNWAITPRKTWWTAPDVEIDSVKNAFIVVTIATMQPELMAIIQFFLKMAEDITGLPMLIQGQLGKAPDTVGGMQMLNNAASSVLRRIARTFDDRITEPHIGRYYEWLLLHGPDEAKGDFQIDARGSSALVERDLQAQALMQMTGMSLNPAYGLDPEKVIAEALKSQRFDPKRLEMDDAKKAQLRQNPPQDPRIATAQINAQARGQELQAELAFEAQQRELDRALAQWEKNIDAQLKAAELAGEESMGLDKVKAMLAGVAMKLRTTRELAMAKAPAAALPAPPVEPPGRAPNGMSYQQ